jgi:hypothetical protein
MPEVKGQESAGNFRVFIRYFQKFAKLQNFYRYADEGVALGV